MPIAKFRALCINKSPIRSAAYANLTTSSSNKDSIPSGSRRNRRHGWTDQSDPGIHILDALRHFLRNVTVMWTATNRQWNRSILAEDSKKTISDKGAPLDFLRCCQ